MTLTLSLETWSWVLTAAGALTAWLAGSGRRRAWIAGLGCQALWLVYAIATGQDGFYGSVAIYSTIYVRNLLRGPWRTGARSCCCGNGRCASTTREPGRPAPLTPARRRVAAGRGPGWVGGSHSPPAHPGSQRAPAMTRDAEY